MNKNKIIGISTLCLALTAAVSYPAAVYVTGSIYSRAYLKVNDYFKNSQSELIKTLRLEQQLTDRSLFSIKGNYLVYDGETCLGRAPFDTRVGFLNIHSDISLNEIIKNRARDLAILPDEIDSDETTATLDINAGLLSSYDALFNLKSGCADGNDPFTLKMSVRSDHSGRTEYKLISRNYQYTDGQNRVEFSKLALNGSVDLDEFDRPLTYGDINLVVKNILFSDSYTDSFALSVKSSRLDADSNFILKVTSQADADTSREHSYNSLYTSFTIDKISRKAMLGTYTLNSDNYLENFDSVKKVSLNKFSLSVPSDSHEDKNCEYRAKGEVTLDVNTLPKSLNGFLDVSTDTHSPLNSFLKADGSGNYKGKIEVKNGVFFINGISLGTMPYMFLQNM